MATTRFKAELPASAQTAAPKSKRRIPHSKKRASKKVKPTDMPQPPLGVSESTESSDPPTGRKQGNGSILSIPCELVWMVADNLPVDDLANLRLTCKDLEAKTLYPFTKRYFKEKRFSPSRYGLQVLVAISQSRMASYVQTLGLGPPSNDEGSILIWDPKLSQARKERLKANMVAYAADNRRMRTFAEDLDMIKTALPNFRNVTTLKFLDGKHRCRAHASYGQHHLLHKIGEGEAVFRERPLDSDQSMSRIFSVALRSAYAAGLKLESIDAQTSRYPVYEPDDLIFFEEDPPLLQFTGYFGCPPEFPVAAPNSPSPAYVFANLHTLRIVIDYHPYVHEDTRRTQFIQSLATFLPGLPSLHTVGICFGDYGLVSWDMIQKIHAVDAMKNIRFFELGGVHGDPELLSKALDPFRQSLEGLKLHGITLPPEGWHIAVEWIADNMEKLKQVEFDENRHEMDPDDDFGFPPPKKLKCDSNALLREELEDVHDEWFEMITELMEAVGL